MTVLIIDIGSSSVRTLLFDTNATPLTDTLAQQPHTFTMDADGTATADVDQLRRLTERCIDVTLSTAGDREIVAVGMATFVGNIVGLSATGEPTTPLYTYADTRNAADAERLRDAYDEAAIHQRTGCLIKAPYLPARFAWIQRTQPALWADVTRWCDLATVFYARWFGRDVPCSYSIASWSGLLDRARGIWDTDWLSALNVSPDHLPELADYRQPVHGLTADYAVRWPQLADVPFMLAVGDGAAANIGSGGVSPSQPVLTIGTTAAIRIVTDQPTPPVPAGLWAYRVDQTRHLIGGATTEGGNLYGWCRQTLNLPDQTTIDAALSRAEPDAHGLTVIPLFAGERSPGWSAQATGTFHGVRLTTTPLDMLQATLEALAIRLAQIMESMDDVVAGSAAVYAGGGAVMQSRALAQMIASAMNRPVHRITTGEVTARGVAILTLQAIGQMTTPPPVTIHDTFTPVPTATARYHAAGQRLKALYAQFYS